MLNNKIDKIAKILKDAVISDDHQLSSGTEKFIKRFNTLSSFPSKARLASALHCFGSEHYSISESLKSGGSMEQKAGVQLNQDLHAVESWL